MTEVLGTLPAGDLKVLVVWLPIQHEDNREAASTNARVFDEPRMVHMWDPAGVEAKIWSPKLGLPKGQLAWDVFIVLPRGAMWPADDPPAPTYWCTSSRSPSG